MLNGGQDDEEHEDEQVADHGERDEDVIAVGQSELALWRFRREANAPSLSRIRAAAQNVFRNMSVDGDDAVSGQCKLVSSAVGTGDGIRTHTTEVPGF